MKKPKPERVSRGAPLWNKNSERLYRLRRYGEKRHHDFLRHGGHVPKKKRELKKVPDQGVKQAKLQASLKLVDDQVGGGFWMRFACNGEKVRTGVSKEGQNH